LPFILKGKGMKNIIILNLDNNNLGDMGLICLTSFIKNAEKCEEISLKKCNVNDMGLITLFNSMLFMKCPFKKLFLQNNNISEIAYTTLMKNFNLFKENKIVFYMTQNDKLKENEIVKFS